MGWLVRKISRAKWEPKPRELGANAIQADAITCDLRTTGNKLSFWQCSDPSNEKELQEVILALAGALERLDKIDIAWIEEDFLRKQGISLEKTPGITQVVDLRDRHVDLVKLDLEKLCLIAKALSNAIRDRGSFRRFTKREVLGILREAIKQKRLGMESLPQEIRVKLERLVRASETG